MLGAIVQLFLILCLRCFSIYLGTALDVVVKLGLLTATSDGKILSRNWKSIFPLTVD
uniref:SGNH domain-containing protein n=1 Tax=Parascaris univalens TaxID=6257 RepID=A0A915AP59_PARUN